MSMFRKVLMTISLLLMANIVVAQGTITGTIVDKNTKEPVPFAAVVAKQDGKQIRGTQTDFNGTFTIKPLPVGKYEVEVSCMGYHKYVREDLDVKASGFTPCNIEILKPFIADILHEMSRAIVFIKPHVGNATVVNVDSGGFESVSFRRVR